MRIALVSPYSWTYPGGVTRHIEALAGELRATGHEARIVAPFDPDDTLARRLHKGAAPQRREVPEGFVSLGRTVGVPANGAVSNLAVSARAIVALRRELRDGGYDVAHIHEPVAPLVSWDALCCAEGPALVGTYHSFSENALTNGVGCLLGARRRMNRLEVRIAVSESAAWTARHFFGGDYRIVPNGVHIPTGAGHPTLASPPAGSLARGPLRILFIGQAVQRKGLPVLLSAFEALREQVPATLTLVGAAQDEVSPLLLEDRGVRALGRVGEEEKLAELANADVLCAPSLSGESFGMVLTEAFAAGLPVVASDIHGYRDVARDGREGRLVAPGDPLALAEALRAMALDEPRRAAMAQAARTRAERFAWRQVAGEVLDCYTDAVALRQSRRATRGARGLALRHGLLGADGAQRRVRGAREGEALADLNRPAVSPASVPAGARTRWGWAGPGRGALTACISRLAGRARVILAPRPAPPVAVQGGGSTPDCEPAPQPAARVPARRGRLLPSLRRRTVLVASSVVVLGLTLAGAAQIGVGNVAASLAASKPGLLTAGLGLMCTAMLLRGLAWHAILRAAPTWRPARLVDALQGTFIGVLMSATLPARLGEPAKALVVARRLGRARETLPLVLGAMVSQMLFNFVTVAALGVVGVFTVRHARGTDMALVALALVPVAGLVAVVLAPLIVPGAQVRRTQRPADLPLEVLAALRRARRGLRVFWAPHRAAAAGLLQLGAWGLQLLSCWFLLDALGLSGRVGMAGAAAILFAVNVTALLPATPANVGVFQAAVLAVLVGVFRVSPSAALAYGIVLQATELLAAFAMGVPALAKEGLSWKELRLRTLYAAPVKLGPLPTVEAPETRASTARAPA